MYGQTVKIALVMAFGLLVSGVGAGPIASATWTGNVEFRSWCQAFVCNSAVLDTTLPPGLTVIVR